MVDKEAVLETFQHYFNYGDEIIHNKQYSWDPNGKLNIHTGISVEFGFPMPDGMWPVEFGRIEGILNMQNSGLQHLEGGPVEVWEDLDLSLNPLVNLKGLTTHIGGRLLLEGIKFKSLEGLPPNLSVEISWYPDMPMLRLLTCKWIELPWRQMQLPADAPEKQVLSILRKWRHHGKAGVIDCKRELVAAGFEGNARW